MSEHDNRQQIEALTRQVGALTRRVYELEQSVTLLGGTSPGHPAPAQPPRAATPAAAPVVTAAAPAAPVTAAHRRARPVYVPPPPREPVNWSQLAEQAFAARRWPGRAASPPRLASCCCS